MITLRTFGECVIEIGRESFTPEADALFAAVLYLAHHRGKRVPRDRLAELIWPALPLPRARHCLRQIIYRMRVLGIPIDGGRETLALAEALVTPTFSAAPSPTLLAAERAAGTLRLGHYLPGYQPKHSEPFAEWVEGVRGEMEARVRRALLELAQVHRLRGEWAEVEALARECVRLDPLNEEANLAIAECAAMIGGKSEALAILDRYIHDLGPNGVSLRLPATVLRRRIAERFPTRRYSVPSDRCFVGRADLLEALTTALLRARNGEGGAFLLTGVPGIGKTRLVQELTSVAVMQGVRTVRVACDETDVQRPMSIWVDAVPLLRELPGALGVSPESLRYLRRLTELDPVEDALGEPLRDPRWTASRIRHSLLDLIAAITAETNLLLVLEDVHWLDAASWAAVTALLETMSDQRLLIVLTTRGPHPTAATPAKCLEKLVVYHVNVLSPTDARELAQAIVSDHGGSLPVESLDWCVAIGAGNPFFLRELVAHCLDGGSLQAAPPSVQTLLDARVARLSSVARRILEASAVLGGTASIERIEQMLQLPAYELARGLEELSNADLIGDARCAVAPRHQLLRARIVDSVAPAVRALLHRRAAVSLESEAVESPNTEGAIALIEHWRSAGAPERAVPIILRAASHFLRVGAPRDAADLLERYDSTVGGTRQQREGLVLLMRAYALSARWPDAYECARRCLEGSQRDDDTYRAELVLIEAGFRIGHDPAGLYSRALGLASEAAHDARTRIAVARLGMMIAETSSSQLSQQSMLNAISDLRETNEALDIDFALLDMIYQINVGDIRVGVDCAVWLRDEVQSVADSFQRITVLLAVSDALLIGDRPDEALGAATTVLRLATELGSQHHQMSALSRQIASYLALGNIRSARDAHSELARLSQFAEDAFASMTRLSLEALLALFEGNAEEAMRLAQDHYAAVHQSEPVSRERQRIAVTILAEAKLRVSEGPLEPSLFAELQEAFLAGAGRPMHDRIAAVFFVALRRGGRYEEAARVICDYTGRTRRALARWGDAVNAMGLSFAEDIEDMKRAVLECMPSLT